jgi:hypothetical protein
VIILDGKCECGFGFSKREFMSEPLKPGEKDWAPTTHNQKCPQCNKEYYLDWIETERTYL